MSIRRRIVWSNVVLIVLVAALLGGLFGITVWRYYYGGTVATLDQQAEAAANAIGRDMPFESPRSLAKYVIEYVGDGTARVELLDPGGRLIIGGDGAGGDRLLTEPDVRAAVRGEPGQWIGREPATGERIAAATRPIRQPDGGIVGLIRFAASVERVDGLVRTIIALTISGCACAVLIAWFVSLLLAGRIVRPISELTRAARRFAAGEWGYRVSRHKEDEFSGLADTLNLMAEEIVRRERLQNEFISGISHELRTPLTSLKGWSETLLSAPEPDPEEARIGLAIIRKETARLQRLVEDLLDFSSLAGRRLPVRTTAVDMRAIVGEAIEQFAARAQQADLKLTSRADDGPVPALVDPDRMKQVLVNLIDNAFKHTPAGGEVTVDVRRTVDGSTIEIRDTGSGIAREDLPYVTEKFYKGRGHQTGSGLGLALCKELLELQGGTLALASEPGAGTTVVARLPAPRDPAE